MRSSLTRALIKLNYDILIHNPISRSTYLLFLILQTGVILLFPFFVFFYNDKKYKSVILVYYEINKPTSMIVLLMILIIFQVSELLMYAGFLLYEWFLMRKDDQKQSGKTADDFEVMITPQKKYFQNLIMYLIAFNALILSIPSRSFALRSIIQSINDQALTSDSIQNLTSMGVVLLITELMSSGIYHLLLQNIFPLNSIPWSQTAPQFQIIQEGVIYLYSICCSIPQFASYTFYIYAISTVFSLISIIYTKTFYDSLVIQISNFNQGCIIMSMLVLSSALSRPIELRNFYTVIIILLTLVLFWLITIVSKQRKMNIFLINEKLTKSKDGLKWLWCMQTHFKIESETKREKLLQYMVQLQQKYQKFLKFKKLDGCTPEFCLRLKLKLIELFLSKIFSKNDQELSFGQKNDILGLILIFKWQKIDKNYLSCIYNLLKFHDCFSCSLLECQQYYFLRRFIFKNLQDKQNTEETAVQFQKMIYFETSFKTLTGSITKTVQSVNEFWTNVSKNSLEIEKSEIVSQRILKNYYKFSRIYGRLIEECGEIVIVESMAWRLNQEILSFEQEAFHNIENLKSIINKQRVHNRNKEEEMIQFNFKNYFIIVSTNPRNFQNIIQVSKSLVQFVGYTEEFLLTNKLQVLLPKVIDVAHEKIIKNYLKRKNTSIQTFTLNKQWLRSNNDTVKPVNISIIPKFDLKEGLKLVGIIQNLKKYEVFGKELSSSNVFAILADVNQKLIHVSENCIKQLKFSQNISYCDLFMYQIFKDLPESLQNQQDFFSDIDIYICQQTNENDTILKNSQIKARVFYNERNFGNYMMLREYLFVFQVHNILNSSNQNSLVPFSLFDFNFEVKTENISSHEIFMSSFKMLGSEQIGEEDSEFQIQNQIMEISSMSSNSSGSSALSSQDAQIGDIKQVIDFNQLPRSLKIYRLKLLAGFFVLLATALTLLIVNIYSKDQFQNDLDALFSEKRIRNNFSSSKLISILCYTTNNIPKTIDINKFGIATINKDIGQYYINNMDDVLQILQSALTDFGKKSSSWDKNFVNMFNGDQLELKLLTSVGNSFKMNMTFQNGMTLLQDNAYYLMNSKKQDFVASFEIFDQNTVQELQAIIKKVSDQMINILTNLYFIVENGSDKLLDQMLLIDRQFVESILSHGNGIIQLILIFTLCCCALIIIMTTFYIPYFFGVEQIHKKMIEFIYKTDKEKVQSIIKQCKDFNEYIKKNQYLGDELKQNQNKIKKQYAQSSLITMQKPEVSSRQINVFNMIQEEEKDGDSIMFKRDKQQNVNTVQGYTQTTNYIKTTGNYVTNDRFESNEDLVIDQNLRIIKDKSKENKQIMIKNNQEKDKIKKLHKEDNSSKKNQKSKFKGKTQNQKSNNKNESESEEEKDDGNKNTKQNQNNIKNKRGQTTVGNDSSQDHMMDSIVILKQTQRRKVKVGLFFYLTASLIIAFYVSAYFMSRSILSSYQQGFYQYDVFYLRNTCVTELYFLMQKSILYNQTLNFESENGKKISSVFEECSNNEIKIRTIKKDNGGMFQDILSTLSDIDSGKYCEFLVQNGGGTQNCYTDANGFITVGLDQIIASLLNHVNQIRISFSAKPLKDRDPKWLQQMFFDETTFRNIGIYYEYLEWTFRYVQNQANKVFQAQMDTNFKNLLAIYLVYIGVIIILFGILMQRMIKKLKLTLLKIRLTLKLIPSTEIFKNKELLEKLNTKLL